MPQFPPWRRSSPVSTEASFHFLQPTPPDPAGIVDHTLLPEALPYGLEPRLVFRSIEDVHDLIHPLNVVLQGASYEPLEDLLDRASLSGLISRTIATRLAEARSGGLVVNQFHNGYPDLIPKGVYPNDAVQRGVGLEVKASRSQGSWQSHGPRPGWFVVVQFKLDESERLARLAREPTPFMAALLANLAEDDWSWTPAQTGRIRSGTASIRSRGRLKLREGAVWVDPTYRQQHEALLSSLALMEYRRLAPERVLAVLLSHSSSMTAAEISALMPMDSRVSESGILASVRSALTNLKRNGLIASPSKRGQYVAAEDSAE